jgi:dihydroorotate dehydrogenase
MEGEIQTPYITSPPFGNYIRHKYCTPVIGSLTLHKRRGWFYRTLLTVRPVKGGWINNIGLRNPGIRSFQYRYNCDEFYRYIYSLVGIEPTDWQSMLTYLPDEDKKLIIELNLSCPNVHEYGISKNDLREYCQRFSVIIKVPPIEDKALRMAELGAMCGVRYIHASNTLPNPHGPGGISGAQLNKVNVPLVAKISKKFPGIPVIAGGGNYSLADLLEYWDAGADKFSFSSVWFNPIKAHRLIKRAGEYGYYPAVRKHKLKVGER